jgi:hypothetical protein
MQQGRVILDADWNEQADIQKHILETEVVDVVGPSGAPIDIAGFGVEVAQYGQDLIISPGRMYVDGILCELDENKQYFEIVTFPSEKQAILPSLNIDDMGLEKDQWIEISVKGDLQPQVLKVVQINEAESILTFNEKVNDNLRAKAASSGVYIKLYSKIDDQLDIDVWASGTYLAYLDVWERHITSVEEEDIREKALDGPDTSTRVKTEWRVKLMSCELEKKSCRQASLKLLENLTDQKNSRLAIRLKPSQGDLTEDPCAALSGTAYRGLENQLYRVEIHEPGVVGMATFKWSRNNGAIAFAIVNFISETETDPKIYNKIRLQQLGWDQELRIQKGDWVEVSGDETELLGKPGTLARVEDIDEADMILTITANVAKHVDESNPKVRRWDIDEGDLKDPQPFNGILTKSSSEENCWTELEDGIEVCFKDGDNYQTGDYWMIAARNTGELEWPHGENDFVPKFGIKHHNCLLAILNRNQDGKWNKEKDCRKLFPPLTDMIFLSCAGGDGQEAMPGYKLPAPFRVRVSRGEHPVEGAEIAFEIVEGQAVIDPPGSVLTGKDGIAQCTCQLNSKLESNCLRVKAALIDVICPDENGVPSHPSIIFNANASVAEEVAYAAPAVCTQLKNAKTVKDAIDGLCRQVSFSCIGGDGQEAMPGYELPGPLRVRAARGSYPVVGAIVKFKIEKEKGLLSARSGETGRDELNVSTDENGIATCFCSLKKDATIEARLQEPSLPDQSSIRFNANVSLAEEVAYAAPAVCSQLKDAKTVKDAIDGLCRQVSFSCVGGDGQEAMPGYELPGPLRVRATRGSYPVVGAIVKFKIEKEKGLLSARSGETGRDELNVSTDENGIASCFCSLKRDATIEASLQEPSLPDQSSIRFNANVSLAEEVAYAAPLAYPQLADIKTVKDALNKLCLRVASPLTTWVHGNSLQVEKMAGEITVARENYATVVRIPKGSKARMHFSIPTIQSPSGAIPVVQEAMIHLKASSLSVAAYVYDGENPISDKAEIVISQNWETKKITLPDKQITTGLGISIIAECNEGSGQIELSAAGCKILSNW